MAAHAGLTTLTRWVWLCTSHQRSVTSALSARPQRTITTNRGFDNEDAI